MRLRASRAAGARSYTDPAWLRLAFAVPHRLPFPLPFQRVIRGNSAVFSPDAHNEQSSENTEKLRDVTVVAPKGPARFRLAIPLRGEVRRRAA